MQPYKAGFGPMLPEIYHLPYPMAYHGVTVEHSLQALEQLFKADVDPARVAAIIIEPVLGEGGFYAAPPELLRRLRSLCDSHGIVLIADEIQSGFGRTGRMFAIEHAGVEPDLITIAKSVAGGVPLSAVIGKADIMDAPGPGGLGGTFAGSPLACAAGLAVLEVMREEQLLKRAQEIGRFMSSRLKGLQVRFPCIGEVRALGAMVAVELVKNWRADAPDAELTKALVQAAGRHGLDHPLLRRLLQRDPLPRAADDSGRPAEGRLPPVRAGARRGGRSRGAGQGCGLIDAAVPARGRFRRDRRWRRSGCGSTRSRKRAARSGASAPPCGPARC